MEGPAKYHTTDVYRGGVFIPIRSILIVVVMVVGRAISTDSVAIPVRVAIASAATASVATSAAVRHDDVDYV
jgi:hypothetical protein